MDDSVIADMIEAEIGDSNVEDGVSSQHETASQTDIADIEIFGLKDSGALVGTPELQISLKWECPVSHLIVDIDDAHSYFRRLYQSR